VDLGGLRAETWAYNDAVPGPLIRATAGDVLRVRVDNELPADGPDSGASTVHWHGIAIRNDMDGVPTITQDALPSGRSKTYEFTAPNPGTYWYHPHVGVQFDRGLHGTLIIDDPREPGGYDVEFVVVLDDWIDGTGTTPDAVLAGLRRTGMTMTGGMGGMGGMGESAGSAVGGDGGDVEYPHYLINGRTPDAPVTLTARPGQRARIRVVNVGADTAFRVALGGHRLTVTHTDGYPVVPTTVDSVLVGQAERYDLLVTLADGAFPLVAAAEAKTGGAMAVVRTSPSAAVPPAGVAPPELAGRLLSYPDLAAADTVAVADRRPDRVHDLALGGNMGTYTWTINNQSFGSHTPLPVREGERVQLRFHNTMAMFHPMHLHGHTFTVRTGGTMPGARKDTVIVLPNQTVVVDFDADNPGQWATHCHNLYHEATGMMTVVSYQA
jgi:FtsP/CotA-like multicopper oxidase with cupredoxin domain